MSEFIEKPASKKSILLRKAVFGVGINDAPYNVSAKVKDKRVMCPYYRTWISMLTRCYYDGFLSTHKTYKDCTVCADWLLFSVFRSWMKKQDWKEKVLDKDILIIGNKHYSLETCVFVSHVVNTIITDRTATKGDYPVGVSLDKVNNKLKVQCRCYGKIKYLGRFVLENEREASRCYKEAKYKEIIRVANEQTDIRVKRALYTHAENIKNVEDEK